MTNTFICFVSRDKELAEQLIGSMEASEMTVEPIKLQLGDLPVEKIKEGFSHADSGSLLLSPAFFKNPWPRSDLDELAAMAQPSYGGGLSIIWSDIDANLIASYSPALASITGYPVEVNSPVHEVGSKGVSSGMVSDDDENNTKSKIYGGIALASILGLGYGIATKNTQRSGIYDSSVEDVNILRDVLVTQFTESDLRDMAYDLGIDYESFVGDTMNDRVQELVNHMRRSGRMDELVGQVEKRTHHAKW